MATITSAQSGNFSATSTWVGGVVPGASDDAVAATGHVVTIDSNRTVLSVSQAGTGRFVLPGGVTLTGNVTINAGTFASFGTVEVTATTGQTSTIVGNISGASSTLSNQAGVVMTGVGTLVIDGTVTGTPGNVADSGAAECAAVYTNVNSTINILKAVSANGTRKYGVYAGSSASSASLTITGNVTGGSTSAHGAYTAGASAVMTITGNVTGGSTNCYGAYTAGASAVMTITGNVTGGSSTNAHGAYTTGTSAVMTITGNATGGSSTNAHGAHTTGTSAVMTITGNATGGGATTYGAYATGTSAVMTITGNVTGGGGTNAYGAYTAGANSLITVTGTVTGVNATGNGIRSDATSAGYGVLASGNFTDSQSGVTAIHTRFMRIIDTSPSGITRYANNSGFPTGTLISRVSANLTTGMPATQNVRYGLTYGYNSELTGTLAVPPTNAVASGVPVDNTVGTAALSPADVAALVGAQIAAALNSTP